jgi:hypothetical protein
MGTPALTQAELRRLFTFNRKTGELIWKKPDSSPMKARLAYLILLFFAALLGVPAMAQMAPPAIAVPKS